MLPDVKHLPEQHRAAERNAAIAAGAALLFLLAAYGLVGASDHADQLRLVEHQRQLAAQPEPAEAQIDPAEVMRLADEYAQQRVDNWCAYDRKREQVRSARAALARAVGAKE